MGIGTAEMVAITLATISPVLLLIAARKALQPAPLSPVWIATATISVVGTFGFLLNNFLIGAAGGSIIIRLTDEERVRTALIYAATAWLLAIGALGSLLLRGKATTRVALQDALELRLNSRAQTLALFAALTALLMVLVAMGTELLVRPSYLTGERGGQLLGLGQQLTTVAVAVVGYVVVAGKRGQRVGAVLLGIAIAVTFFGLGSRRMALLPIIFAVGAVLAAPQRWKRYVFPALILAALLLPLPLFLRGSTTHGILPYIGQLSAFDLGGVDWRSTANNVLISFPITGATVFQTAPIPMEYFWISLNPLPGELAGFYNITQNLGLNRYTPYSTIGEVWNRGPVVGSLFWLIAGGILRVLDESVGRWMASKYSFVGLGVVVLTALFALTSLQYNLRASGRMIIYAIALTVIAQVALRPRRQEHHSTGPSTARSRLRAHRSLPRTRSVRTGEG